jgi:hypothetical protein
MDRVWGLDAVLTHCSAMTAVGFNPTAEREAVMMMGPGAIWAESVAGLLPKVSLVQ